MLEQLSILLISLLEAKDLLLRREGKRTVRRTGQSAHIRRINQDDPMYTHVLSRSDDLDMISRHDSLVACRQKALLSVS